MPDLQTRPTPRIGRPPFLRERVTFSVNLERQQAEDLRGLSVRLGVTQADLTREALGLLLAAKATPGS
jgi:hypothetical protein